MSSNGRVSFSVLLHGVLFRFVSCGTGQRRALFLLGCPLRVARFLLRWCPPCWCLLSKKGRCMLPCPAQRAWERLRSLDSGYTMPPWQSVLRDLHSGCWFQTLGEDSCVLPDIGTRSRDPLANFLFVFFLFTNLNWSRSCHVKGSSPSCRFLHRESSVRLEERCVKSPLYPSHSWTRRRSPLLHGRRASCSHVSRKPPSWRMIWHPPFVFASTTMQVRQSACYPCVDKRRLWRGGGEPGGDLLGVLDAANGSQLRVVRRYHRLGARHTASS